MNNTFEIKEHQKEIVNKINELNKKNLYYFTIQQNKRTRPFTYDELKKHIDGGIKKSIKDYHGINYIEKFHKEILNKTLSFVTIFETSKEFFWSQNDINNLSEDVFMGLHFHLFISTNQSSGIYIPQVINNIIDKFNKQTNKYKAIKKVDYNKIKELDNNFMYYHTKQGMFHNNISMIHSNV
jgi:hypothetical protein